MNSDMVVNIMKYHVLNGSFPASKITATEQFIPTLLTNSAVTNVTGGQAVGAVLNGKSVDLFSGLKEKSTVVTAVSPSPCSELNAASRYFKN